MSYSINGVQVLDSDLTSTVVTITAERQAFPASSKPFEGIGANTTHGYIAGGRASNPPGNSQSTGGSRFPFATDEGSTTYDDNAAVLLTNRELTASSSSTTHGYAAGGMYPYSQSRNQIEKFPLSSAGGTADVGDLTQARRGPGGNQSTTHGYSSGGSPSVPSNNATNIIDKFPFSTDENATDVGDLSISGFDVRGASSGEHGYQMGRRYPPTRYGSTDVDRFPFASDGNSVDVGDLVKGSSIAADGVSSATHGYSCGGYKDPSPSTADLHMNEIQRLAFASAVACVDIGNLTDNRYGAGGHSSSTHGYCSGGWVPTLTNIIDKFPFSKDDNATDVGDLSQSRYGHTSTEG